MEHVADKKHNRGSTISGVSLRFSRITIVGVFIFLLLPLVLPAQENDHWVEDMFSDQAQINTKLLPEFNDAYGVAFRDLTNDGWADLYVVRFRNLNRLFINRSGITHFKDRTIQSGLGGNLAPSGLRNLELGASVIDYNNDGIVDVLVTGWGGTTHLFQQTERLRFVDVNEKAGIRLPMSGNAGVWADVDRDGDLDLFITDEHSANRLYIQVAPGKFENRAADWGVADTTISQGAAFSDIDGDFYPDLYVCNWLAPDYFYKNIDGKHFERVPLPIKHLTDPLNSNGVTFGDIDNDGDPDLLVTDRQGQSALYRNEVDPDGRKWKFINVTHEIGLINSYPAYSGLMADFNNDGWLDVFFTNIGPNELYLNRGQGHFKKAYQDTPSPTSQLQYYSTGAAVADVDHDGDLDLFIANKDTNCVLAINPLNRPNSIRFRLEGVRSNREAIGAKVWLFARESAQQATGLAGYREVSSSGGYLSANEAVVHFGVEPERTYLARIQFPSGRTVLRDHLRSGQVVFVSEMEGAAKTLVRAQQYAGRLVRKPSFWLNLLLSLALAGLLGGFISLSIYRYQWTKRQTAGFLTGSLVLLYLLFGLLSGKPVRSILLVQLSFMGVVILIVAGFMERIRQLKTRRYSYRYSLQQFSERLILIRDNDKLAKQLVNTTLQTMDVRFCAFAETVQNRFTVKSSAGKWDREVTQFEFSDEQKRTLIRLPGLDRNMVKERFPDLYTAGARYLVPIKRQEELLALLLLGQPAQRSLPKEDIGLLTILANQAALTIENNRFIEETRQLTRKVTASETREKYIRELEEKNATLERLFAELKETQAQLVQSEKLSSLGQLVAGIAHELNNPIGYIYANMRELQKYIALLSRPPEKEPEDEEQAADLEFVRRDIHTLLDESLEGSKRVKEIVTALRNFSRLDEAEFKRADIHEGLESTLMLLNNEFGDRIRVQKDYDVIPPIDCLPGHLNQVFMNLLLNAAQAIRGEGTIWITTRKIDDRVRIVIRDNGPGIPKAVRENIFDPFFTTKPVGMGTGLGLSISYGIIRKHDGTIEVSSKEGEGTTFTITLPMKQNQKADPGDEKRNQASGAGVT